MLLSLFRGGEGGNEKKTQK